MRDEVEYFCRVDKTSMILLRRLEIRLREINSHQLKKKKKKKNLAALTKISLLVHLRVF